MLKHADTKPADLSVVVSHQLHIILKAFNCLRDVADKIIIHPATARKNLYKA